MIPLAEIERLVRAANAWRHAGRADPADGARRLLAVAYVYEAAAS